MDFVRLGERYTTDYLPDYLIEGYESLIWAERFSVFGDFELKTRLVNETASLLPPDTLVSHLETAVVMKVETLSVEMVGEGADAVPELTIKGRYATTILESRWIESRYGKTRPMRQRYSALAAAEVLIFNSVDNPSGKDVTRGDPSPRIEIYDPPMPEVNDFAWNTKDVIPNIAVTDTTVSQGAARWWQLEQGEVWPQLEKILQSDDIGLRFLRPIPPNDCRVVKVKTNLAERGQIERVQTANFTGGRFDLYMGVNRADNANEAQNVEFMEINGHLEKPQLLESLAAHRTSIEVKSGVVEISDISRPVQPGKQNEANFTGWKRKSKGVDAGTPEIPDAPQPPPELKKGATKEQREKRQEDVQKYQDRLAAWKNKREDIIKDFREEAVLMAQKELKATRPLNMFTSDISPLAPYVYGTHYNLGDTVMIVKANGTKAKMVVSEYVRTEDVNGDRGMPGLVEP